MVEFQGQVAVHGMHDSAADRQSQASTVNQIHLLARGKFLEHAAGILTADAAAIVSANSYPATTFSRWSFLIGWLGAKSFSTRNQLSLY